MYAFLSEISNTLSSPFFQMVEGTKEFPLLAAVVLGIIGALAPCQLTGNIGAMTLYGARSLETGQQWKEIASFILGKITVFSGLGLVVLVLGMEIQTILSPDNQPIRETYTIEKVYGIVPATKAEQLKL